jgi:hypothetical protein
LQIGQFYSIIGLRFPGTEEERKENYYLVAESHDTVAAFDLEFSLNQLEAKSGIGQE